MHKILSLFLLASLLGFIEGSSLDLNRGVIVHLFEWKFSDIARECEEFLGPRGFTAVQISPPNENLVLSGRPWYERYQPVSYNLTTRSGDKHELADMISRCNKVGVRVFADVILNHMTSSVDNCKGTANSSCDAHHYSYPAVPYSLANFHQPPCEIKDYDNATEVRVCELVGLHDLNQTQEYVRQKLADFLNELIDIGIAGVRVDAAKHIFPEDLAAIYNRLHNLNTSQGFSKGTKPFIYQEVTRSGKVVPEDYTSLGFVTEFNYGSELSNCFQGKNDLKWLSNFGTAWGLTAENRSLVFIENHDKEREKGAERLTYKFPKPYKMAIAFMLAWPYGTPKVMSSFQFSDPGEGPPHDSNYNILTQRPIVGSRCSNGWVCQHRWHQIVNMVTFHNVVAGTNVSSWWDNGKDQISFCRGNKGFIAFNLEVNQDLNKKLQTCLPRGIYCDIISGGLKGLKCTGKIVEVNNDGTAQIHIGRYKPNREEDGFLALHVEAALWKRRCDDNVRNPCTF